MKPLQPHIPGSNFLPKRTVTYNWNGTGVKVTGSDASAQIDTTGLQPGAYVVTANLSGGRKNEFASCSARFTVKQPRPPVISCSADPSSVPMGATSTAHFERQQPRRPQAHLQLLLHKSPGDISGSGSTAALSTRGARPGRITVTCNVNDDRTPALTASSTTEVQVQAPPLPPAPCAGDQAVGSETRAP